ncbi:MAG: endonuclease/exonuclease/phosphatase family protein [Myxococcota bacterium]
MSFRIATYNVLADAYIRPERYRGSSSASLDPVHRRPLQLRRVANLASDVICLQEVEAEVYEALDAALPEYVGTYAPRRDRPDGVATFVRSSGPGVQATTELHYATPQADRDHLALLTVLQVADRRLVLANTHLRWQPAETPIDMHEGVLQLRQLLDALEPYGLPYVLAGDLNAISQGPVIRLAQQNGLRVTGQSLRPWDTALIEGRRRKLDYVLVTTHFNAQPQPVPALSKHRPIPSSEEPSDHIPYEVILSWQ